MRSDRQGVLIVLCGPSGTGKSTLIRKLRGEFPRLSFSISCTTRAPRTGEKDGIDYHFLDRETFEDRVRAGFFAEWAEVHGNLYGTPLQVTQDLLARGRDVLFDVDVAGARQLRASMPQGWSVFLFPPTRRIMEERLRRRGTDDEATIERRLRNAGGEIAQSAGFDFWIVNDNLEAAYDRFRAVYLAAQARPALFGTDVARLIGSWGE